MAHVGDWVLVLIEARVLNKFVQLLLSQALSFSHIPNSPPLKSRRMSKMRRTSIRNTCIGVDAEPIFGVLLRLFNSIPYPLLNIRPVITTSAVLVVNQEPGLADEVVMVFVE
jgi:hypothetical protein